MVMNKMKSISIDSRIQRALDAIQEQYPIVGQICSEIIGHGGRVLLVGGAVRDALLGIPIKDIDFEVHGMAFDALAALLGRFGTVSLIGKSFGVLRHLGTDIDWAVPRSDAPGRKPVVKLDPHMAMEKAFARRDLTINAMGIDMQTRKLIDPFGGKKDLEEKRLRAPDPQFFKEDPLRLFRVMQFISRFEMTPDEPLNELCSRMDIREVSKERIEKEFAKMLLKSKRPSRGIRWLYAIGRLSEILPELAATVGIKQEADYHPEGDVFEHTMQTLDAAAAIECVNEEARLILLYAALCHDLGKVTTTQETEDETITSYQHAEAGYECTKIMLRRMSTNKNLIDAAATLVNYHMAPLQFVENKAKPSAYKRLALKLDPYPLSLLADLAMADKRGRNPKGHTPLKGSYADINIFRKRAEEAQVLMHMEPRILHGADIQDIVAPGPQMGLLLKRAYQIQLDEGITDKAELKKRIVAEQPFLAEQQDKKGTK